jgi:demethylmenaquinone methyltransferase/2-methoxy-6-polyprenyl-1,4-benzoquinol methylase
MPDISSGWGDYSIDIILVRIMTSIKKRSHSQIRFNIYAMKKFRNRLVRFNFASDMSGLGLRFWWEVIDVLRSVIPVYDKVNSAISLGKDAEFRREGIRGKVFSGNIILDAGSGYGNMSNIALGEAKDLKGIVLYDPISEMLSNADRAVNAGDSNPYLSSGVFEHMPFRDNTFDVVMCGYSLRDAIDLNKAVAEIHRVLKQGGRFIIVDIGKPDNSIIRSFVSFYLRYILGIIAFTIAGKSGLKFRALYGTYIKWPHNSELHSLLAKLFSNVEFEKAMMGAAIIVVAYK